MASSRSLISILFVLFIGIIVSGCSSSSTDDSSFTNGTNSVECSSYTIVLEASGVISDSDGKTIKQVIESRLDISQHSGLNSAYKVELSGDRYIVVTVEDVDDIDEVADNISATGKLEFKKVDQDLANRAQTNNRLTGFDESKELLYEFQRDDESGRSTKTPYVVDAVPLLTGAEVENIHGEINSDDMPVIRMKLTPEGSANLEEETEKLVAEGQNSGRVQQVAIVIDGEIMSVISVEERIFGGSAIIKLPSEADVGKVNLVLQAGPLPIDLSVKSVKEGI